MGINEVTKFLEATAAAGALRGSTSDRIGAKGKACPPPAFAMVLICKDVRPARLVEHLQALVRLTGERGGVQGCVILGVSRVRY